MATNNGIKETGGKKRISNKLKSFFHRSTTSPSTSTENVQSDTKPPIKFETATKIQPIDIDAIAQSVDSLFYPLKRNEENKVGKGIIIVNKSSENNDEESRAAAEKDKEHYEAIFDKLGIDYKGRSFINLTIDAMWKELKEFANIEVPEDCVFFVAISTNSEQMGQITDADNFVIPLDNIYNYFYKNINLLTIPKVFLIDASKVIPKSELQSDMLPPKATAVIDHFKAQCFISATSISDTLIVQSYLEICEEETGSVFIEELHNSIDDPKYENLHFVDILTLCNGSIIDGFPNYTASIHSTLRMKLSFQHFN